MFLSNANNKGADQPAHPRSLISTFVVCSLDSIIPVVAIHVLSFKPLPSFCGCTGLLVSYLVVNPEDRFSRDEVEFINAVSRLEGSRELQMNRIEVSDDFFLFQWLAYTSRVLQIHSVVSIVQEKYHGIMSMTTIVTARTALMNQVNILKMRKGTILTWGLRYFKRACAATQKVQICDSCLKLPLVPYTLCTDSLGLGEIMRMRRLA